MTHTQAVAKIRGKRNKMERKLGNNTTGRINADGSVGIVFHKTEVVTIHTDGTYTLRTGGWKTYTTRSRIEEYAPVRISGKCQTRSWDSGEWTVRPTHGEWDWSMPFTDGMRVNQYQF